MDRHPECEDDIYTYCHLLNLIVETLITVELTPLVDYTEYPRSMDIGLYSRNLTLHALYQKSCVMTSSLRIDRLEEFFDSV